jgi:small subunit ribosomal protein S8
MSMQDLVSDFVARINNAVTAGHDTVVVLKNKVVLNIAKKLVRLGYFDSFKEDKNTLEIVLNASSITKLKRVSKPGKRVFVSYKDLPKVDGGRGWNIISTSKGVMTNFEAKNNLSGGELLFQIV